MAVLWPVSAKAVVVRDRAVLLARNDRGEWELPGGRVERDEEPAAAVVREVFEETGLLVRTTSQLGVATFEVLPDRFVLLAAFTCTVTEDRDLVLSEEHESLQWQPLARLDELSLPHVYRTFIVRAVRGRVVLLGDSHLAKLDRRQLQRLSSSTPLDTFVISVGTNDYAPWKQVPLHRFRSAVEELLDGLGHHRSIVLLPPPIDEHRQIESGRAHLRTEQDRAPYAAALAAAALRHRAQVIDLPKGAWNGHDGVHLSDAGYCTLISRIADALAAIG